MAILAKREDAPAPNVPQHIAIIMDGNGRWAKNRFLPRTAGHAAGAETFRKIALYCRKIGVKYLTVYAFSTENWKRPQEEVGKIMGLMKDYLLEALRDMQKNHVRIPDPDLIIRPGGELRISNFLLWQAAYAEFYFTDVLWPDFDEAELDKAIAAFQGRNRRFGGIGS